MIAIDDKLISDEIIEEHFVCDLSKCKGGCCEEGDAGAPLEKEELDFVLENYDSFKKYMSQEGINEVEKKGKYRYDRDFGWVTPTIGGGICAYGIKDKNGIILCAIEQAFNDKKINWKKPISCHLYPIRISKSSWDKDVAFLNYVPREGLCNPACSLGKKLKIPVFVFLKDALIRKFGNEFYGALVAVSKKLEK
jgi:hypothetical protein